MSSLAVRRTATSLSSSTRQWISPRCSCHSGNRNASTQHPLTTPSRTPQQLTSAAPSRLATTSAPARAPASSAARPAPAASYARSPSTPAPPAAPAAASTTTPPAPENTRSLADGLDDEPLVLDENSRQVDWSRSFHGLSDSPFSPEAQEALLQPIDADDIEIKPDGIIYLPEIKYRRILNKAFGPGGWGLAPRGETIVTQKSVTREYGLVAGGRLVSIARGEQQYFDPEGIPTATEGCKSNALMRCCKDLGVASELWDPRFIRKFMAERSKEVWVEHAVTKKRKKIIMRKDDQVRYPLKEVKMGGASGAF